MKARSMVSGSMSVRLQIYFILFMIVPLIISGVIFYYVSSKSSFDLSLQSNMQILHKASSDVDNLLDNTIKTLSLVNSNNVVQRITSLDRFTMQEREEYIHEGDDALRTINDFQKEINGIYIIMNNGISLKSRYFDWKENIGSSSEIYAVQNHSYPNWIINKPDSLVVSADGEPVLMVLSSLHNYMDNQVKGTAIIEVPMLQLGKLMHYNTNENFTLFLTNEQNKLVALSDSSYPQKDLKKYMKLLQSTAFGYDAVTIDMPHDVLICERMPKSSWMMVGIVSKTYLKDSSRIIGIVIFIFALISLILTYYVSRVAAKYELKPINRMVEGIKTLQGGNFDVALNVIRDDEVGILTQHFNNMTKRLKELIGQISIEQKNLQRAELKALQSQITPHFLYNTLESISALTRLGRKNDVLHIVSALTTFFRTGLSQGKDIITIHEEIKHIRSYLVIQKIRYSSQFSYEIYAKDELMEYLIPKMTIQPLVENALYHGIKNIERKCLLNINVFDIDDYIMIEIIDNGAGMDEKRKKELMASLSGDIEVLTSSFGTKNVSERIQNFAGNDCGLSFESEVGTGTIAIVKIKKIKDKENNVQDINCR